MLLPNPAAVRRRVRLPATIRALPTTARRLPAPLTSSTLTPGTIGRLLLVGAFLLSGIGGILAKSAYVAGATPVSFLLTRLGTAVVILALLTRSDLLRPGGRRIVRLLALGLAFGSQTMAYYSALEISPVGLVVVVVSTYPIVIITMDAVSERALPSPGRLAAMAASLVGLWLAAGSPTGRPDTGLLLALTSALGYATYLRLSARALAPGGDGLTPGVPPAVATAWVMCGALIVIAAVALISPPPAPAMQAVGLGIVHGGLATAIPIVAVYAALQRLSPGQIAVLGPLEPIVATGVAGVVLGESLTWAQAGGIGVVLLAVAQLSGVLAKARPRAALPRLPFGIPARRVPGAPVAVRRAARPLRAATAPSSRPCRQVDRDAAPPDTAWGRTAGRVARRVTRHAARARRIVTRRRRGLPLSS